MSEKSASCDSKKMAAEWKSDKTQVKTLKESVSK
jgi:hypothetical protein